MKPDKNSFIEAGLSIVLASWLVYTVYWFIKVIGWVTETSTYTYAIDWVLAIAGTFGLVFRIGACLAAILAFYSFLKGGESSKAVKFVGLAIAFEAFYFLCFAPSAFFGFQAGLGLSGGHSLQSGQGGGLWFIIETGVPTLVEAIIMPVSLIKLRSKLTPTLQSRNEIIKWASVTGVSYIIVFWLTYFTQWIATFMQPESYASVYPGYGIEYLLSHPLNVFTFILTSVGLPLLAIFFWWSSLPAKRDPIAGLNLRRVGITLTLLGGYFIAIISLFRIFGTVGGSSIWIIFFMFNNADLWCVTLPALGIPLILAKHLTQGWDDRPSAVD